MNIVKDPYVPGEAAVSGLETGDVHRKLTIGVGVATDTQVLGPDIYGYIGLSVFEDHGAADV